jgi:small GTP-binding protein
MVEAMVVYETGKQVAKGLVTGSVNTGMRVQDFLSTQMNRTFPGSTQIVPVGNEYPQLPSGVPQRLEQDIHILFDSAKKLGDTASFEVLRGITEQISSDFYQILIVGHFSAGKSRLLNELIGRSLLPENAIPTTKTLTWLLYGEEERAFCQKNDDSLTPIDISALTTVDKDELNLFAFLPAEILRTGIALIDSAGLGDPENPDAVAMTEAAVKNADAVVLVIDAQYGQTQSQQDFINALKAAGKTEHLLVVINKMDRIDENERKDVVSVITKMFQGLGATPTFFPLSCKEKTICDNGFERFRGKLIEFMQNDLHNAHLSTIKGRLQALSADLLETCRKRQEFSAMSEQKRTAMKQENDAELQKKRAEIERMISRNRNAIAQFGEGVKINWKQQYIQIKDTIEQWINKAVDINQLSSMQQLQGEIEIKTNQFLTAEFTRGKEEVAKTISEELSQITVPVQELPLLGLRLKQRGWINALPQQTGSAIALVSLFTKGIGFFSLLGSIPAVFMVVLLSPVFDKLFGVFKGIAQGINLQSQKKQALKAFEENYLPEVDNVVKQKINEFTYALQNNMEQTMRELLNCYAGTQQKELDHISAAAANDYNATEVEQTLHILQGANV